MSLPSDINLSYEEFLEHAQQMFNTDQSTLEKLYPMVLDLRDLARQISHVMLHESVDELSETATGE